jgi:hypothetical protein
MGFPIQIEHLGSPQADLLGGSGGADAPPGIKLGFVFSQPRASTATSGLMGPPALGLGPAGEEGGRKPGKYMTLEHCCFFCKFRGP